METQITVSIDLGNKDKCIKRIFHPLLNDATSNLEKLSNHDIDEICKNITVDKLNKSSSDYGYLKQKNMALNEYILILFTLIKDIISLRISTENDEENAELRAIEVQNTFFY